MEYGTRVTTPDGVTGYVLGWQDAPVIAPYDQDLRVFRFDSDGEPCEHIGTPTQWETTGESADKIVLAHMKVWQAERDLIVMYGTYDVCQKCGGRPGAVDDMHRCLC